MAGQHRRGRLTYPIRAAPGPSGCPSVPQVGDAAAGYRIIFTVGFLAFRLFGYDAEQPLAEELGSIRHEGDDVHERDFLPQLWPLAGGPFTFPPKGAFTAETLMSEFG